LSPGETAACVRAAECACSCLRCDRARRQERRRGDQWQRDDQHVRLVLRSARRSNSVTATAQGPLCQHARPLYERNEIPQLSVATSRSRAEEVRSSPASSPAGERRPAKGRSTPDGNPSSLPTQALNRTVRARRRELRNAALSARSKGPYRTWVRSRGQPLRRVEETSRAERLPGFQALTKSSRHGRITLVRRTQRFGRGLSCTRPPGFRRPSCKRFLFEL